MNPDERRISLRVQFLLLTLRLHTMQRLPASDLEQRYSDYYHSSLETEPFADTGRSGLKLANISRYILGSRVATKENKGKEKQHTCGEVGKSLPASVGWNE